MNNTTARSRQTPQALKTRLSRKDIDTILFMLALQEKIALRRMHQDNLT